VSQRALQARRRGVSCYFPALAFAAVLAWLAPAADGSASDGDARNAQKAAQSSPAFRAGFAERDVTPDLGMEMMGNYGKEFGTSIHDPCKVRAAVFDDGRTRVALVGLDALMIHRDSVERVRKAIEERCGIPAGSVLLGASHSHSSGPVGWVMPGEFDRDPQWIQDLAYRLSPCANPVYLERFEKGIVDAVLQANAARTEARLSFASGREDGVAFNRRLRMKNGRTFTHPGQGNPDTLGYAGPTDPEVGVIGAWDGEGRLLGVIVNFSCHATTSPPGFSANWIYYLEKTIRGALDTEAPVVFLQGACGDITQVDNLSNAVPLSGDRQARIVGGCVGAEVVKRLLTAWPGAGGKLDVRTKTLRVACRRPDPERVRRCEAIVRGATPDPASTDWIFAKEIILLDAMAARSPSVDVEVQAIQVGPAVFVANPAEYFVELGLEIKKRSPHERTWVVELANGCVGYVPTEEAFSPAGGGYETRLTSFSSLEVSAGRKIVEASIDLLKALTPASSPAAPAAPAFRAPWSYGDVPPELK
jgi:neutral ceramidase